MNKLLDEHQRITELIRVENNQAKLDKLMNRAILLSKLIREHGTILAHNE